MPVTVTKTAPAISKKKTKAKRRGKVAETQLELRSREQCADDYILAAAELREAQLMHKEALDEIEAWVRLVDERKKELIDTIIKEDGDDAPEMDVRGSLGTVKVGKAHTATAIKDGFMPRVLAAMEKVRKGLFLEVANVSITDMRRYFTDAELKKLVVETTTPKRRSVKIK